MLLLQTASMSAPRTRGMVKSAVMYIPMPSDMPEGKRLARKSDDDPRQASSSGSATPRPAKPLAYASDEGGKAVSPRFINIAMSFQTLATGAAKRDRVLKLVPPGPHRGGSSRKNYYMNE